MTITGRSPSKRWRSDAECLNENPNLKRGKCPKPRVSKSTPPESRRRTRSMTLSVRSCPGTKQSSLQRQDLAQDSKETTTSPRQGNRYLYIVAQKPMSDRKLPNVGEILDYFQTLKEASEYVWAYCTKLDDGHVSGLMLDKHFKDEKRRYPRLLSAIGLRWEVSIRMHQTEPEKSGNGKNSGACWLEHYNAHQGLGGLSHSSAQDGPGENFSDAGYYSSTPSSSGSSGSLATSHSSSSSNSSGSSSSSCSYHTACTHFSDDSSSWDDASQSSHDNGS